MDEDKHSEIVETKSDKETLAEVKERLEIKRVERKDFIEKVNDYSTLITTKVVGLGSLAIGVSELLAPTFLPIVLASPVTPFALISVSMAFLLNKRAILVMQACLKLLAEYEEEDKS